MTSIQPLHSRTIQLIEADIQVNNDLLSMALRIEDPRMRAAAYERITEGIERTKLIIDKIKNHDILTGVRQNN